MSIQFLVPMVLGREKWQNRLIATVPKEIELISLTATPSIKNSRKSLLDKATAEYIAMVDDDDELVTSNLAGLFSYIEEHKPLSIMTSSSRIDYYSKVFAPLHNLEGVTYKTFLDKGRYPHQLIVCKLEEARRAWTAADEYVTASHETWAAKGDTSLPDPFLSFDIAFCWELLLSGKMHFYSPLCYLWRVYDSINQVHVIGNKSHFLTVTHYRDKFKKLFLNDPPTRNHNTV